MIDLIIKPTQACNFTCTFCSSNQIAKNEKTLKLPTLFSYLEQNEVGRIIVNGGDPLMMPPDYYWKLIAFLDEHQMETRIDFTTNLWDFYLHPDKWESLFRHPRVGVCTSFQYGEERKLRDGRVFSEDLFRKVFQLFEDKIGYKLTFISVITEANEDRVLDTVRLAKSLGTQCKINPAFKSGRSHYYYPFHRAYEKYLDIIDAGLADYEFNAQEIRKLLDGARTHCPYCRGCYHDIRAMSPDGLVHSCGAFNDDHYTHLACGEKTYCLSEYDEKELMHDYRYLKPECLSCDLFLLCNSCYKRIADIRSEGNTEMHCMGMRKLKDRITRTLK